MSFTPLPADLPTDWQTDQIVAPDGTSAGLTGQHGYNYLNGAVNQAHEAINAHHGQGGETQHPAATQSVTGFLSAEDKAKLDGLNPGGYMVQTIGSLVTTLAAFNSASPKYGRGVYASRAGEIDYSMTSFACATVLSMVVDVAQNTSVTIPIFCNDDTVKLYIDGVQAYSRDGSGALTTTSESLTAGEHRIQWLINNYDGASYLHVGEWFNQYVTFVRAATS